MMSNSLRKKIAKRIVWGMNMKKGESLIVRGGSHFQDLLEEIAIQSMKQDIDIMFTMSSDDFTQRVHKEVPITSLKRTPKLSMKLLEALDNYIGIDKIDDPKICEKFPLKKIAALREAGEPISKKIQRLGIKTAAIGYPTKKLADKLGTSFPLLKKFVFNGMLVDHKKLLKNAAFLETNLKKAEYVHAYDEFGTDIKLKIKNRTVVIDDGYLSDFDIKNKDLHNNLPCGEVFVPPIETYGSGVFICPKRTDSFTGKIIENIKFVFENGKLNINKTTAEKNEKALKTTIKNCISVDKKTQKIVRTTNIAELGVGLNPAINKIIGYLICDEKIGGTIHIAIGENKIFPSGKSESCLHWDFISNKGICLEIIYPNKKSKILIENGKCCY